MFFKDLILVKQYSRDLIEVDGYLVNKTSLHLANVLYDYSNPDSSNYFTRDVVKKTHVRSCKIFSNNVAEEHEKIVDAQQDAHHLQFVRILNTPNNNNIYKFVDNNQLINITGMLITFEQLQNVHIAAKFKIALMKILNNFDIAHIEGNASCEIINLEHLKFPSIATFSFVNKKYNPTLPATVTYPLAIDMYAHRKAKFTISVD